MSAYRWEISPSPEQPPDWPAEITPLVGRILWQRGFHTPEAIQRLLHPRYIDLPDPSRYRQLDQAVARLIQAIQQREQITVFGDYDADGICATAIVVETLTALGAHVDWYLPDRLAEGYGLNSAAIETIARQGTRLLITVDCGTTNLGEIAHAHTLGLEVIVLDHHQAPAELPATLAIINPHVPGQTYPFSGHSSGGVGFTLMRGLLAASGQGQALGRPLGPGWEKWLLDLVAISTVADLMPLQGDNRLLVHFGLQVLRKTRRPGLQALARVMGTNLTTADEVTIGYQIAPRLNAAGRLLHAGGALRLLLEQDLRAADQLASDLDRLNAERQKLTELAMTEALEQVAGQGDQAGYVAFAPHWSPGIIGLVAGRLAERVWRPVLVMTANGDSIVGSGRSIPGFDLTAHLRLGQDHFERFGGHAGACGFTLAASSGRQAFVEWFQASVQPALDPDQTTKTLAVDTLAELSELSPAALDQLEVLGPFGVAHPRPRLLIAGVTLVEVATVGKTGQHLRLVGQQGHQATKFIGFGLGPRAVEVVMGQRLDLVVEASWNEWNGRREAQLKIIDWRPSA